MKCFRAIIKGNVQGVGFRFNTMREANHLSIGGWVKNLPDNTVEVFAEGSEENITKFLEFLKKGPIGSRITKVLIEEKTLSGLTNFEVRY